MKDLLDETVIDVWVYIIESMFVCGRDAMKDADFRWFVINLQRCYPDEFEVVMEVLEAKDFLK